MLVYYWKQSHSKVLSEKQHLYPEPWNIIGTNIIGTTYYATCVYITLTGN